jgi:hypothetical protein
MKRKIKKLTFLALILFILYLSLTAVFEWLLYQNKAWIEKEAAKALNAESVNIGGFFNIPFINFSLFKVEVKKSKIGNIEINKIDVYYNPFTILFQGAASSIYSIGADQAFINASLKDALTFSKEIKSRLSQETNPAISAWNIRLFIQQLSLSSALIDPIEHVLKFHRLDLVLNKNFLFIHSDVFTDLHALKQIDYFYSAFTLDFHYQISNKKGTGSLFFQALNFGGISLAENQRLGFSLDKTLSISTSNSIFSNRIQKDEKGFSIRLSEEFTLDYQKFKEFYFFEHLFEPGKYRLNFSADLIPGGKLEADIRGLEKKKNQLHLQIRDIGDKFALANQISSGKFGWANLDIKLAKNNFQPSGIASFSNFPILDGLNITGDFTMAARGAFFSIFGQDVRINGGFIGNAFSIAKMDTEGIQFYSPKEEYNASVRGNINLDNYEVFVEAKNVTGQAVVSNIYFDVLGIGKGVYDGIMRIYPQNKLPSIEAEITGFRKMKEGVKKKTVEAAFSFRDNVLQFSKIHFLEDRLNFKLGLNLLYPQKQFLDIDITGSLNYRNRYNLPVSGKVHVDYGEKLASGIFNLDKNIEFSVENSGGNSSYKIDIQKYSLQRIGLAGILNFNFSTTLSNNQIELIQIHSDYLAGFTLSTNNSLKNKRFSFNMKAKKKNEALNLERFSLDTQDDQLFGFGQIKQYGSFLSGKVSFLRGGGIDFTSSFEELTASVNLKNILLKDFIAEKEDISLSLSLSLSGPLVFPNFSGNLKIASTANAPRLELEAKNISYIDHEIHIKGLHFLNSDNTVDMNSKIRFDEDNLFISADGNFSFYDSLKGAFAGEYTAETNRKNLSYTISSLKASRKNLKDISGSIQFDSGRWNFTRRGDAGLVGFFSFGQVSKQWKIDFAQRDISCRFTGETKKGILSAEALLDFPLEIISYKDIVKDLKGNAKIALKLNGPEDSPLIDGLIQVYHVNFSIPNMNTRLSDLSITTPIIKNKLILQNAMIPTSTGNFVANGYLDFSDLKSPYLNANIVSETNQRAYLDFNINYPSVKLGGNLIVKKGAIAGNLQSLMVEGEIIAENNLLFLSINPVEDNVNKNGIFENINWNVTVKMSDGVKFANEFVDGILKKDDIIIVLGSFRNNTFTIKGNVGIYQGTLNYLGRSFSVKEGSATFNGVPGDPMPYVVLNSVYLYKDETGGNVNIYLTFEGKAPKIIMRDFYSNPARNRNELNAVLGLGMASAPSSSNQVVNAQAQQLLWSSVNVAENVWIISPLSMDIKRRLGLDLFNIRTGLIENWTKKYVMGDTNVNIWEGTTLSVGKFILPSLFFEYGLTISRSPFSSLDLVPLHSFGLQYDFNLFDLGWKMQQIAEEGKGLKYEQLLQLNFNRRF